MHKPTFGMTCDSDAALISLRTHPYTLVGPANPTSSSRERVARSWPGRTTAAPCSRTACGSPP